MKKSLITALAAVSMLGVSAASFAVPGYQSDSLWFGDKQPAPAAVLLLVHAAVHDHHDADKAQQVLALKIEGAKTAAEAQAMIKTTVLDFAKKMASNKAKVTIKAGKAVGSYVLTGVLEAKPEAEVEVIVICDAPAESAEPTCTASAQVEVEAGRG
jgi:hypothetical protein